MSDAQHPFKCVKLKKKATAEEISSTKQQACDSFCVFIDDYYADKENCFESNVKKPTKCECWKQLLETNSLAIVANIISKLTASATEQRDKFMHDVIGSGHAIQSTATGRNLLCCVVDKDSELAFCENAIRLILSVGRKKFRTIATNYATATPKLHGTTGKHTNNINYDALRDVIESFIKLSAEEQGESHATRFLREHNKVFIRDAELDTIELPSHCTKRHIYRMCCWEQGWITKTNGIGQMQHAQRDEVDASPTLSWPSFLSIWNDRCSNMRIRPPSRDTCDLCFKHKMVAKGLKNNTDSLADDARDDDDANNQCIVDSATHIRQARAQRVRSNEKVRVCEKNFKENLHFYRSNYAITFDFAQNLALPRFGDEQPGDAYCFSPLSLHVFGIVDHSPETDYLCGFLYHEGEGKKGANNAASLIKWFLFHHIIPSNFLPGAHPLTNSITWVCDNCAGQNKNNVVPRLANMLVEGGYFNTINACFLVKGHTKNSCD